MVGRLPQTNVRSQLYQFIVVRNTLTPARLSTGEDRALKPAEVVLKRDSEVDVWGLARNPFRCCVSPFVTEKAHMRGDLAE